MNKFYVKKSLRIAAFKLGTDTLPDWFKKEMNVSVWLLEGTQGRLLGAKIETLEGVMIAQPGDYLLQGIKGEIYPCKPDIFEASYNQAPDLIVEDFC
jgi:hypothetical protein